jgi:hypothetical protein
MLSYYVQLTKTRIVNEKDRQALIDTTFRKTELIEVQAMTRNELMLLMAFCDIRIFNDQPVISLTDNELRMAYIVWRGTFVKEKRQHHEKAIRLIRQTLKDIKQLFSQGGF